MAIAGVLFLLCLLVGFVVIGVRLADLVRKSSVLEDEIRTLRSALARLETDIARLTFGRGAAGEVRTAPE
ncbi:hypothetical protein EG829_21805, partial [bacterium]|nr:hypothetical protein [bacterium]